MDFQRELSAAQATMKASTPVRDYPSPPAPRMLAQTGLDTPMLVDLCARHLLQRGRQALVELAQALRLPPSVTAELLQFMRAEKLVEVLGHGGLEAETRYQLGEGGHRHAREALARSQYAGPAPVALAAYRDQLAQDASCRSHLGAARVRELMRAVVMDQAVLDQIGAAMNSGRAILLYGPAGSGKTFLAEHLAELQPGHVHVPHAITAGGEIISVFDPLVHEAAEAAATPGLMRADADARWVRCRRPVVIAGGELTLQMMDLQFDASSRFYQAPPHLKANGGVFVVDDLGRQLVSARDLMNRWIVPLDRNRDYLTLHTGYKFAVPFSMTVIFCTNLRPDDLADEAFLRRFGYKVYLGPMDPAHYRQVFQNACGALGVRFDAAAFDWLLEHRHRAEQRPLLACYPRDLVGRVRDFALYEDQDAVLSRAGLERAWTTYFCTTGAPWQQSA